jgi:hypothetical protein
VIVAASVRLRRRGILPPGLTVRAVLWVCQKIASRPLTCVKTNWERASRGRSSTKSITAPRLRHRVTGVCSMISASLGQAPSRRWQYTRGVAGHDSRAFSTIPPALKREQQQVGQLAVGVWVTGNEEGPAAVGHAAAA